MKATETEGQEKRRRQSKFVKAKKEDIVMNEEQIAKAKEAKSAEELLALAKENGMEMTEKEAADLYERLHSSAELTDEELENVAGGCGSSTSSSDTVTINGVTYKVCKGGTKCFTGKFKKAKLKKCEFGGATVTTDVECCGNCDYCRYSGSASAWICTA